MAELAVVQEAGPAVITAEAIAAALERRKERQGAPREHYDEEIGGVFRFRTLTGAEVRECRRLATVDHGKATQRVDSDKLEFYVVNKATVDPKVTTATWLQLGQLGPLVQNGLAQAIFTACGLLGDPVADAGKDSTPSPI